MAAPTNYVKIGLFITMGLLAVVGTAIALGVTRLHRETIPYFTYVNESVAGLDLGAPVKLRGVKVGQVGDVRLAPDGRLVEVKMQMDKDALARMGVPREPHVIPADLRAQIASQGLTGASYVSIDFFDSDKNPPPVLHFTPADRYIPAATSELKNLEDSLGRAMDGLAALVGEFSQNRFGEKSAQAVETANQLLSDLDKFLNGLSGKDIPQRAATAIDELRVAVRKIGGILDRVDGDTGLVATMQHSASAFGEVGRGATGAARDLDDTLTEIRETASALRLLAEELERQPDALLKGRAKSSSP